MRKYARYGICREALEEKIQKAGPDIILITTGMTYWYEGVREVIDICRRSHGNVPIVAGGIYATLMADHCRDVCGPDHVVEGEGEGLLPILEQYRLPQPQGSPDSRILHDDPVWRGAGVIRLNRGCPMACHYCASRCLSSFKEGDPLEALERLEEIHRRWGTRHFAFYDDALLIHRERVIQPFLEELARRNYPLSFYLPNAVHARFLDKDLLDLMKRTGFQEIRMGYESSSDDFHHKRDGKIDQDLFERTVRNIRESDFPLENCTAYVLAGLPGQTWQEVERSLKAAASLGIRCRIAQYSPVPGSSLWNESCRSTPIPLEKEPVYHNSSFMAMEWEGFTREDLERLKRLSRGIV